MESPVRLVEEKDEAVEVTDGDSMRGDRRIRRLTVSFEDVRSVLRASSASISAHERRRLDASYSAFRGDVSTAETGGGLAVASRRVALA